MLWDELFEMAVEMVGENVDDTGNSWFKKYPTKFFASGVQNSASKLIKCIDASASITMVAGTETYDLPTDFLFPVSVNNGTTFVLEQIPYRPRITPYSTGTPIEYYLSNNKIGLYPTPSVSGTLTLYYKRMAPRYAFRITEYNSDSTTCTFSKTDTAFLFTISGGVKAGTTTLSLSTYTTIGTLITAINAANKNVKATIASDTPTGRSSTDLEEVSGVDIHGKSKVAFYNPELPSEMQSDILLPAIMYFLKVNDRETGLAQHYYNDYNGKIKYHEIHYQDRNRANRNASVGSISTTLPVSLSGSFIIVP